MLQKIPFLQDIDTVLLKSAHNAGNEPNRVTFNKNYIHFYFIQIFFKTKFFGILNL